MSESLLLSPISSVLVGLLVFIFCLLDELITAPLPWDIIAPVCPGQSMINSDTNYPSLH